VSYTRFVKAVGLYLVRNEVDLIETNLRHHFARVIDEAIVIDNGSSDGTLERVAHLAADLPIQLASEVGPMFQAERVTRMARFAVARGADWLLPIDADEFWVGAGASFRDVLEETPGDVRALFVEVVNFVQRRDVLVARPGRLASMTMRPERAIGPAEETSRMVREGEIGWLEALSTPKCVLRASPDVVVANGNHVTATRDGMPTERLTCLHAPIRARSVLTAKLDHGRRLLEVGAPAEAGWHVKRWWQMAREGTFDREWDALSYEDGAIAVAGRRHQLVRDDRLRDTVVAVAPDVRTTDARAASPVDEMAPAVGAYLLGLDTVPGWFSPLDFRVFVELDRIQHDRDTAGDLFEIGAYLGKSAILLGHLVRPPTERLTVCDVFEHVESVDAESFLQHNHWYSGVSEKAFLEQYKRFHEQLPDVIVGSSETIDAAAVAGTCRIVHLDGGHRYEIVRHDVSTARVLLGLGGIVALEGIFAPHHPGAALAVWELVLSGTFVPLCVTESKLYGTWDEASTADWAARIDEWVAKEPDLGLEVHTLAERVVVRRLFTHGRPPAAEHQRVRIPDLADIPGPESPEHPTPERPTRNPD
jgi:Glycosyl transferase family 2/Methyltransferase domain